MPTPRLSGFRLSPRLAAAIGLLGLILINVTYWFTIDRAPSIKLRWRDDVSAARQAQLEQLYGLVDQHAPVTNSPRSVAYDLRDTTRRNIEAMVTNPEVADTNDVDRDNFEVYLHTGYGENWMWWADRQPLLRSTTVRWSVLIALVMLAVYGLVGMSVEATPPVTRSADEVPDRLS